MQVIVFMVAVDRQVGNPRIGGEVRKIYNSLMNGSDVEVKGSMQKTQRKVLCRLTSSVDPDGGEPFNRVD